MRNLNYMFEPESRFDSPKWPSNGRGFDVRIALHDLSSLHRRQSRRDQDWREPMPSARKNAPSATPTVRPADATSGDSGKVRLGGASPSLPVRVVSTATADSGKVRLGGASPSL